MIHRLEPSFGTTLTHLTRFKNTSSESVRPAFCFCFLLPVIRGGPRGFQELVVLEDDVLELGARGWIGSLRERAELGIGSIGTGGVGSSRT